MRRSTFIRSFSALLAVGTGFAVVGCGGAIPAGIEALFANGQLTLTPGTGFNGDATQLIDPQVELASGNISATATLSLDGREVVVTVPTDRPVLGQIFNLHSSSGTVQYSEEGKVWNLGNGFVRFGIAESGPALYFNGTLSPDTGTSAVGESGAVAVFSDTGIDFEPAVDDARGTVYYQTGQGDPSLLLSGTSYGGIAVESNEINLLFSAGDQRLSVTWNTTLTPGQEVGTEAAVEYNPDVNGSTGYIEANSGHVHVIYESGKYTVSLVNVEVTVSGTTYRLDGFISAVYSS